MALITRLSRLFQADLHAVLDSIEEPQTLLKQAVREMEEELIRSQQRLKQLQHDAEQTHRRAGQLQQSLHKLGEEFDVCLASGNDDLARSLIKRKLQTERLRETVEQRRAELDKQLHEQQAQLKENRLQFESMQQKAELFAEEQRQSVAHGDAYTGFVGDDEVEVALLREKQRRGSAKSAKQETPR